MGLLTNTNVDLSDFDFIGYLVHSRETRRALSVYGVDRSGVWNAREESSHTGG